MLAMICYNMGMANLCNLWNTQCSRNQHKFVLRFLEPPFFLNPAWTSGISHFIYGHSLFCVTLLLQSLMSPFFGIGRQIECFQSAGHCSLFSICWHTFVKILMDIVFVAWNGSIDIPSISSDLFLLIALFSQLLSGQLSFRFLKLKVLHQKFFSERIYYTLISSVWSFSVVFFPFLYFVLFS